MPTSYRYVSQDHLYGLQPERHSDRVPRRNFLLLRLPISLLIAVFSVDRQTATSPSKLFPRECSLLSKKNKSHWLESDFIAWTHPKTTSCLFGPLERPICVAAYEECGSKRLRKFSRLRPSVARLVESRSTPLLTTSRAIWAVSEKVPRQAKRLSAGMFGLIGST